MKKEIHPQYFKDAVIECACGAKFIAGSTVERMTVELCSRCHPFYTGQQKIVDTARRVEKFEAKTKKKQTNVLDYKAKVAKKIERAKRKADKRAKAEEAATIRTDTKKHAVKKVSAAKKTVTKKTKSVTKATKSKKA